MRVCCLLSGSLCITHFLTTQPPLSSSLSLLTTSSVNLRTGHTSSQASAHLFLLLSEYVLTTHSACNQSSPLNLAHTSASRAGSILAVHPELREELSIHSKANAALKPHCNFSKESVLYQANGSLDRLGVECLDIYYLHRCHNH